MKTYEEAYAAIVPRAQTVANVEQQHDEIIGRYGELLTQIMQYPKTQELISFILCMVNEKRATPESALATAFVNGIMIGIEMEKQDV